MKEVLKIKNILYLGFVLWLASCSGDDIMTGNSLDGNGYDPVGTPILFSVGLQDKAITRTDPTTSPMAKGSRFVCTMYYHPHKNDNNSSPFVPTEEKIAKAWLEVSDDAGNAAYKNEAFSAGTPFYWQNRLNHAFVAIANNNDLTTTTSQAIYKSPSDAAYNTYDLTKGEKTAITQQPDPIRAKEIKAPSDNTPANNSVTLNFQHQFSQIQVNVKNATSNSTNITAEQITKVELLGVSTKGYVYTKLNTDGTITATTGDDINLDGYTDVELAANKWGTSFEMFKMASPADGSFNAIAFGHLRAIRVTWDDGSAHTATFEITEAAQRDLASGKKYVYNLEISNTTPAAARGQVVDRALSEQVRLADVTITNWPLNIE